MSSNGSSRSSVSCRSSSSSSSSSSSTGASSTTTTTATSTRAWFPSSSLQTFLYSSHQVRTTPAGSFLHRSCSATGLIACAKTLASACFSVPTSKAKPLNADLGHHSASISTLPGTSRM
eukprot:261537-Pyramimonas_sp.AAC.1